MDTKGLQEPVRKRKKLEMEGNMQPHGILVTDAYMATNPQNTGWLYKEPREKSR